MFTRYQTGKYPILLITKNIQNLKEEDSMTKEEKSQNVIIITLDEGNHVTKLVHTQTLSFYVSENPHLCV